MSGARSLALAVSIKLYIAALDSAPYNHPINQSLVVYNGVELELSNGVNAISYDKLAPALQH